MLVCAICSGHNILRLSVGLLASDCYGKTTGETCQMQCIRGYDLVGTAGWCGLAYWWFNGIGVVGNIVNGAIIIVNTRKIKEEWVGLIENVQETIVLCVFS